MLSRNRLLGLLLAAGATFCASPGAVLAQSTARFHHTTTLLPNGNILIVGGVDTAGTPLTSVEIRVSSGGFTMGGAALPVARASHTATLLPNGRVLVAGGIGAGGTILSDSRVYDPVTDSWSANAPLGTARYNHTATLLANGTVLIAGGQSGAAAVTNTCEIFTAGSPGSFSGTGSMSLARAGHSASFLYNNKVLVAGGYTLLASPNQYAVSTELFESGVWTPGPNLIQQRGYHTATVMGDRNVLIVGGFNGRNQEENQGILQSVEIYNPVADTISPADPMEARKMFHSAMLLPDGTVSVYGGLGNITTTYFPGGKTLEDPSDVDSTQVNLATGSILGASSVVVPLDFILAKPVNGVIVNGDVLFSSPTITLADSKIYFTNPGTRASLNGVRVGASAGVDFLPGQIITEVPLSAASGQIHFYPQNVSSSDPAPTAVSGGPTACTPASVGAGGVSDVTAGTLTMPVVVPMPATNIGGTVQGTCEVVLNTSPPGQVAATITATSSYTITLTTGIATACGGVVVNDGSGGGRWTQTLTFTGIQGLYTNTSDATRACNTENFGTTDPTISGVTLRFTYVVTPVNVSNQTFSFDIATVTIKSMVFGDKEEYTPETNAWAYDGEPGASRFNHGSLLTPAGDETLWGGRSCDASATCTGFSARTGPGGYIFTYRVADAWTATSGQLGAARANHSATVLPDGRVLAAGGTNGPNVLASAETFNEDTGQWTSVGSMVKGRNLHTATLLPNGTVLVAGGFTAQGLSSATSHSEIFYPPSNRWVATTPMVSTRSYHTSVLLPDGNVMVFGGYNGTSYLSSAEIYYSTGRVWRAIPTGAIPARAQHTATLLQDGRVLIVGGVNSGGILSDAWTYSTLTGAFTAQPSLPVNYQRHSHSATLLRDGRVLVAGGNDGFGEVGNAIIFDPASPSWTPTSSGGNDMLIPRLRHTATLLPNGKVLISGGVTALGGAIQLNEGFDVDFTTWQAQGRMIAAKGYHATVLLPNGNLLNVGGFDGLSYLTASEVQPFSYDPDASSLGAPPSLRIPQIVSVTTTTFDRGIAVTINGTRLKGVTEGSGGGAGSANSSFHNPRVYLQRVEFSGGPNSAGSSGFMIDLSTGIYAGLNTDWTKVDSSITLTVPQNPHLLPYGWYHLRVAANAQFSESALVQAGPQRPSGVPGIPSGILLGASSVSWTWSAAAGTFDGYSVYSATDGVFLGTSPAASFVQTGLGTDSVAQIMVAAYNLSGDGPVTIATVPVNTLNSSIGNLQGVGVSESTIAWSWDAVSGAISYNVFSASAGFLVGTSGTNSFFYTGLSTNTSAGIQVQAVTAGGAGLLSASATVFTLAAIPIAGIPALDSVSTGSFRAVWSFNTNPPATRYVVRVTTPSAGFTEYADLAGPTFGVTQGIPPNSLFIASVTAVNGDGVRTAFVNLGSTATFARAPSNLVAASNNASTINLSWSNNGNPSYTIYQVLYSSDNFTLDFSTRHAFAEGFTGLSTVIDGLQTGVTYTIRVAARNLFSQETAAVSTQTATNNGGGPVGTLTVIVQRGGIAAVSGTLGGGRTVGARFPVGVFDHPSVTVRIATSSVLNCGPINSAIEITADGAEQPVTPFEFSMSYDPAEPGVTDPAKLTIVRYHPGTGTCVPLTAHVDTANRVVRAQVNHLSLFQLQQVASATDLSRPRVFPNPLYTRNQGFFTFDRMPPSTRVQVFTLHGEELFEGSTNASGMLIWNARNKHERPVASGVYLAIFRVNGEKKVFKLAVVR